MKNLSIMAVLAASLYCTSCGAHTSLMPVGTGQVAPNVSIGGPIVEAFDTHIPVPYLMAGADYGLNDIVNINASVHLLPLAYRVAGVDVGAAWFPVANEGWKPTIGLGPRLFVFASTRQRVEERLLVFPAVSASAAWETGPGLLYTGSDLAIPLARPEYDDEAQAVILSPFLGYRWPLGRRYVLLSELKWHGANIETDQVVTGYTAIGKQGAVTPLFAVQRRF